VSFPAYPKYKNSGVQWLGQVPSAWASIPFGALFRRTKRTGFSDEELLSVYRDYGVIRKSDRDDNFNNASEDLSTYQLVEPGDLAMNKMKAWQGSLGISSHRGIVSPAYFVFVPRRDFHPAFMHYLLRSPPYAAGYMTISKGIRINQWDVDPDHLSALPVLLPSFDEQEAIAAFLDRETAKIDALVAEQERLIALLKEKRQAVISHAVTKGLNLDAPMKDSGIEWLGETPAHWEARILKSLVERGVSISYGIVQPGDNVEGGVPFIQTTNMSNGNFDLSILQRTDPEIASAYPRSTLLPGDVILGIRASIGAAHIVPDELAGANLSRGVARIQCGVELCPRYLVACLGSASTERYWQLKKQGSTFNEVSIDTVKNLKIALPPKDEQEAIVLHCQAEQDRFEDVLDAASANLSIMQERRAALICTAVTGKIDVRGLADTPAELEVA